MLIVPGTRAGDPHSAAVQVRAGLAITAGDARLHCTLGLALLDLTDYRGARQSFNRALELDPAPIRSSCQPRCGRL
jgi:Flp pilus assembly protein TadD